jgi:RHS repeat-associated protein
MLVALQGVTIPAEDSLQVVFSGDKIDHLEGSGGREDLVYYYTGNHLSSTQLVTDGTGVAVQQVEYAPFGEVVNEYNIDWNSGQVPDFKFNGKELDEESNMYYFEHRYHAPPMFISRDILFEAKPWMSPYAYCSNSPVNRVDPSGMLDDEWEINVYSGKMAKVGNKGGDKEQFVKFVDNNGKVLGERNIQSYNGNWEINTNINRDANGDFSSFSTQLIGYEQGVEGNDIRTTENFAWSEPAILNDAMQGVSIGTEIWGTALSSTVDDLVQEGAVMSKILKGAKIGGNIIGGAGVALTAINTGVKVHHGTAQTSDWVDLGVSVAIFTTGMICPPLGLALGIGYAIYSFSPASTKVNNWLNGKK